MPLRLYLTGWHSTGGDFSRPVMSPVWFCIWRLKNNCNRIKIISFSADSRREGGRITSACGALHSGRRDRPNLAYLIELFSLGFPVAGYLFSHCIRATVFHDTMTLRLNQLWTAARHWISSQKIAASALKIILQVVVSWIIHRRNFSRSI